MNSEVFQPKNIDKEKSVTDSPLVSIVTPVLQNGKFIEGCIKNILSQNYSNIEHIFVDGGSTDGSLEVLTEYQTRYPCRVRFISEPDRGVGDAANKGWRMAKGEILGWIDADDTYEADTIQAIVSAFRECPDVSVVFGGGRMINEKGELLRTYITNDFNLKETITDRNQMHTPPSAFYKREVIGKLGLLFPDSGDNLSFHIRVAKSFKIKRIDKLIFNVKLQQNSISMSKDPKKREYVRGCYRTSYLVCRQYGGSIFSPRCRRYFIFEALNRLHLYDFVVLVVLVRLRHYSFVNRLLSKLGMVTN